MRALLDINVLLALLDRDHVEHARATEWFDRTTIDTDRRHGPKQVTDAYLLALTAAHGGRFATVDRAVPVESALAATAANLVVI